MPGATLPVGTVTFLFTDMEGSTRLARNLGDRFGAVLDLHNRLLHDIVTDAGGMVIRVVGDGFFCVFISAARAVSAAVDAQQALAAQSWPDDGVVRVRMGMHTGEGVLGGDSYVGLDVHRAARIGSAGHGGQVLLSQATATLVSDDLPPGVQLRDMGEHELKDLGRAERLYQLVVDGLDADFPPIRSLRAATSRLPTPLTSFVGRSEELTAVTGRMEQSGLLTLLGPGGSGKTRLAIEGARRSSAGFDGFHFVDLSAASTGDLLPSFVASAMSVVDSTSTPASELIAAHISTSRYLLVLDNCEHVAGEAAALITRLLERCPGLTVLATSREVLGVAGEQVQPVRGLSIEEAGDRADAVQLFLERASSTAPHLDSERWLSDIEEVCRRLDGIPLAIELAAARTNLLTPKDVLDRLEDRFALLRSTSPTASPRHRSLEAAISWSYEALEAGEQSLLRRLSVFRGGFTLQAVDAVCVDSGPEPLDADVLDLLASLVSKSFVSVRTDGSGARYSLLETIREYAAVRLEETGEAQTVSSRHRDYYLEWAKHQARRLSTADQLEALAELEEDHDNLRAVLVRAIEDDDREPALAMAATLVWFWYVHSHFTEGNYWSSRLLASRDEAPTRASLRLLIGAGDFDFRIGEHERAAARFTEALRGARVLGSDSLTMWALAYAATNDALQLKLDDARASLDEALRLANELGDFLGVGYCTFMDAGIGGWIALQKGELELLPPLLEKLDALADMVRAAGERNMIGHVLQGVGLMCHWTGERDRARRALEESLTAFAEIETLACASHCLEAAALVVADTHPTVAVELLAGTGSIRRRIGVKTPALEQEIRHLASEGAGAALGADDVDDARERGRHLTVAEATALARQALLQPDRAP